MNHTSSWFPLCPSPLVPCRDLSQVSHSHRRGHCHSYPCVFPLAHSPFFDKSWIILVYSSISDFSTMNYSQISNIWLRPLRTQGFSWSSSSWMCSLGYKSERPSHVTIKNSPTSTSVGHSQTPQHVSTVTADIGTREQEAHGWPQRASLVHQMMLWPKTQKVSWLAGLWKQKLV